MPEKLAIRPKAIVEADAPAVRLALQRIQSDETFLRASRMSELLAFLVEEALAGAGDKIKAFTVAQGVFGRDESFDAQYDTIVRVEVSRLRRRLHSYYLEAGRDDPLVIDIPRGTYKPVFKPNVPTTRAGPAIALEQRTDDRPATPGVKPLIMILPLGTLSDESPDKSFAVRYVDAVVANLTKLSGLSVMAPRSGEAALRSEMPVAELRGWFGVTHVVEGTFVERSGTIRISARLIDTRTGSIVWAEQLDGRADELYALEDRFTTRIATALSVSVDPDETKRIYLRHTSSYEALDLFRRALISVNPPFEKARVLAAKEVFERVIELDPVFAGGFAGLSLIHSYLYLFEHGEDPAAERDEAFRYAIDAIELDDAFAMGHSVLGLAHAMKGDIPNGMAHARYAVELEPGDPLVHQWLGGILLLAGDAEAAVEPLREAMRLDPIKPREPFLSMLGVAYFNLGRYDEAAAMFDTIVDDVGIRIPNMEAYRAAANIARGRRAEAEEIVGALAGASWTVPHGRWIRRWTPDPYKSATAITALQRLGLADED